MLIHANAQNLHGIPVAFLKKAFSVTNSGINAKIPVALLKTTIFVTISGMPILLSMLGTHTEQQPDAELQKITQGCLSVAKTAPIVGKPRKVDRVY